MAGALPPEWVEALVRETEGNPFFVVEILRELTEAPPRPGELDPGPAPVRLSRGAVRRFSGHRLARIDPEARALLELAAVVGREIDLELLGALEPERDLERWLEHCASAALLEPTREGWRFAHDKVRELLIDSLEDAKRARLHGRIAAGLEALARTDASATRALARHHRAAGDRAAEARYAGPAGADALAVGAHGEAIELLERALELGASSSADRASWLRMLGEARYVRGDHGGAARALRKSVGAVAADLPAGRLRLGLRALRELLRQLRHLAWKPRPVRDPGQRSALREASSAAGRLANLATYRGDALEVITASLLSANLADRAGWTNVYGLAVMGYSAAYLGAVKTAEAYFRRSREAAERQEDLQGLVEAIQMECVLLAGTGAFAQADALLDACLAAAERAGYRLGVALTRGFRATLEGLRGRTERALEEVEAGLSGLGSRNLAHRHAMSVTRVDLLLATGAIDRARARLEEVEAMPCEYALGEAFVLGVRARRCAAEGEVDAALDAALELEKKLAGGIAVPPISVHLVLDGMSEAYLLALAEGRQGAELSRAVRRHRKRLRQMAKSFSAVVCEAERFTGQVELLRDRPGRARRALDTALAAAERLDRRDEARLAQAALGALDGPAALERRSR